MSMDEYDDLPDDFDFSAVVEPPAAQQPRNYVSMDEYDVINESDSFSSVDLDSIAALGRPRGSTPMASATSTQYSFDEVNPSFLEEVDEIERNAFMTELPRTAATQHGPISSQAPLLTQRVVAASAPPCSDTSRTTVSWSQSCSQHSNSSFSKRKRSTLDDGTFTVSKKSKGKGRSKDPHAAARVILTEMEDSIQCPICCGMFVSPHVGIPCGHSYCGECCIRWIKQNPGRQPSCPTCRVKLTNGILLVPNFSLQHAIDRHVAALGATGVVDWQLTGARYQERQQRQQVWSELCAELPLLQRARWGLSQPDGTPTSQLVTLLDAQREMIMEENSSSDSEESIPDDSQGSSQDLFSFFPTPPALA